MKPRPKILSVIISILLLLFVGISLFVGYRFYLKKAYPIKYQNFIEDACKIHHIEEPLVLAVIRAESKFQENANSKAGAIGLMQITPETFEWLQRQSGKKVYLDETNLKDPKINIEYGTYFLSILKKKYSDEKVILSAYNAGMGTIDKWLKDPSYSLDGKALKSIPYPETENYVENVLNNQKMYKKLYYN